VYSGSRVLPFYSSCYYVLLFISLDIQHFNHSIWQVILKFEFHFGQRILSKISRRDSYYGPRVRPGKSILIIHETKRPVLLIWWRVAGQEVTDDSKEPVVLTHCSDLIRFYFSLKVWRWGRHIPSKSEHPLTQRCW
jgi:hypothetical protein